MNPSSAIPAGNLLKAHSANLGQKMDERKF